jgi:hypothetical protein
MIGFLENMIVSPNPASNPIGPVTRRLMGCVDLFNSGFYNEAFISAFALLDDLVQNVAEAGMTKMGLADTQKKEMLRAIKEERLKHFTGSLFQLCGWQSLERANEELYKNLIGSKNSTNSLRNKIMHGNSIIDRSTALTHIDNIMITLAWLSSNPFGYQFEPQPRIITAQPAFAIFDEQGNFIPPDPPGEQSESDSNDAGVTPEPFDTSP